MKTSGWLVFASLLGLFVGASCGSDDKCSREGCHDQFLVNFEHEEWADGAYEIHVTIDGDPVDCEFVLPFGDRAPMVCPDDGGVVFWAYRENSSSPYLPRGIIVIGEPDEVSVSVSLGGETLASESFEVGDDRRYPNGPDCDNGCLDEQDDLEFDASAGGAGGSD